MGYVRLKDIAEEAGVTVTAVSRALKNKKDIGEATRKRIQKIADDMGYIPDTHASRLRSNANRTVGVVVTYLDNFFYNRILMGITDALAKAGYTPIIFSNQEDREREEGILKTLAANRVAGALIVPAADMVNQNSYGRFKFPCVTIVRRKSGESLSSFVNDSEKGGALVGGNLAGEGRRHPVYIGVDLPISCNRSRLKGFGDALDRAGIPLEKSRILDSRLSLSETYQLTRSLIKRDGKIDGVFVYNDNLAFAVIRALVDAGVKIPQDVRVYGHDDVKEAQFSIPSLSTIKVPKYKLGFESASALVKLIEEGSAPVAARTYEPKLILRES